MATAGFLEVSRGLWGTSEWELMKPLSSGECRAIRKRFRGACQDSQEHC